MLIQNDLIQNNDLAQKDDLLFGTHGTENMPTSAVGIALRVSAVFCVLVLLFLYDFSGDLCYRLVCHRSNEALTGAHLVFIADESIGIDRPVELGGVAVPFHQSLHSSTHLATLQYGFHAVHFIGGSTPSATLAPSSTSPRSSINRYMGGSVG